MGGDEERLKHALDEIRWSLDIDLNVKRFSWFLFYSLLPRVGVSIHSAHPLLLLMLSPSVDHSGSHGRMPVH